MTTDTERTTERVLHGVPETTSESEEMYLITVARTIENGHTGPVPVPLVAEALDVSRVSANEMAKKLVGRNFLEYEPYKGVTLTGEGTAIANRILRRRRLWALFLAEHLGLTPTAADEAACEFEHVTPTSVADRLSAFLGEPTIDPEGKPIPPAGEVTQTAVAEVALPEMAVGDSARVVRLEGEPAVRSFLVDEGIVDGLEVRVMAIGADTGRLVRTPQGHIHLSAETAAAVIVTPLTD